MQGINLRFAGVQEICHLQLNAASGKFPAPINEGINPRKAFLNINIATPILHLNMPIFEVCT